LSRIFWARPDHGSPPRILRWVDPTSHLFGVVIHPTMILSSISLPRAGRPGAQSKARSRLRDQGPCRATWHANRQCRGLALAEDPVHIRTAICRAMATFDTLAPRRNFRRRYLRRSSGSYWAALCPALRAWRRPPPRGWKMPRLQPSVAASTGACGQDDVSAGDGVVRPRSSPSWPVAFPHIRIGDAGPLSSG
jgi:hypothetical protein